MRGRVAPRLFVLNVHRLLLCVRRPLRRRRNADGAKPLVILQNEMLAKICLKTYGYASQMLKT